MTDDYSLNRRQTLRALSGVGLSSAFAGCSGYIPDTDSFKQTATPDAREDTVENEYLEVKLSPTDGSRDGIPAEVTYSGDFLLGKKSYRSQSIRNAISDSNIESLRFPGGITSNFYDWESDSFMTHPATRSPDYFLNEVMFSSTFEYENALSELAEFQSKWKSVLNWPGIESYGFEDYLSLTEEQDIDRVIALNLATSPKATVPPEQHIMGWLDELGYTSVDRFEIGTHLNSPARYFNQMVDGQDYFRTIKPVVEFIQKNFRDVEVVVYTGNVFNSESIAANNAFAEFEQYDSITIHSSPPTNQRQVSGTETPSKFKKAMTTDAEWALTRNQSPIATHPKTVLSAINDAFGDTELTHVDNGGPNINPEFHGTMLEAVLESQYILNWFAETDSVRYTVPMFSRNGHTIKLRKNDLGTVKTPLYHSISLFSESMSGRDVQPVSESLSVTGSSTGDGNAENGIDVWAVRDTDKQEFRILFASSEPKSKTVDFRLPNKEYLFSDGGEFRWVSGGLDERNTIEEPDLITVKSRTVSSDSDGNFAVTLPRYSVGVLSAPYSEQ